MKRIGFFTGKIYDEIVNPSNIKECCRVIHDLQLELADENYLSDLRKELNEKCKGCFGCEESKNYQSDSVNFEFSTMNLSIDEREKLLESVNLIPVGTTCFKAGDRFTETEKITVDIDNQKLITMFWNCLYFLEKSAADEVTTKISDNINSMIDRLDDKKEEILL